MTTKPTAKQLAVLQFMYAFFKVNDQLPLGSIISKHFGWKSSNAAAEHMTGLERKEFLTRNAANGLMFTAVGRSLAREVNAS